MLHACERGIGLHPGQTGHQSRLAKTILKRKSTTAHDSQSKRHRSIKVNNETSVDGLLVMKNMELKLLEREQATKDLNLDEQQHQLRFTSSISMKSSETVDKFFSDLIKDLEEFFADSKIEKLGDTSCAIDSVLLKLHSNASKKESNKDLLISWRFEDEDLGSRILRFLRPTR